MAYKLLQRGAITVVVAAVVEPVMGLKPKPKPLSLKNIPRQDKGKAVPLQGMSEEDKTKLRKAQQEAARESIIKEQEERAKELQKETEAQEKKRLRDLKIRTENILRLRNKGDQMRFQLGDEE